MSYMFYIIAQHCWSGNRNDIWSVQSTGTSELQQFTFWDWSYL